MLKRAPKVLFLWYYNNILINIIFQKANTSTKSAAQKPNAPSAKLRRKAGGNEP
jgi:hypothetical protein